MKKSIITSLCLLMLTAGLSWSQYGSKGNYVNLDKSRYSEHSSSTETVVFEELFNEGLTPDSLATRGWVFINSDGGGTSTVFGGNTAVFSSYEGPGRGYAAQNYQGANGTKIDQWLISPVITVNANDTLSFWYRSTDGTYPDSIDVLISPTGGATIPDFTYSYGIHQVPINAWAQKRYVIPVSGSIRIAYRYLIWDGGSTGSNSDYWGLDVMRVYSGGTPPGAFHLLEPADDTRLLVHSTSSATADAVWTTSVDPGTVTYTFVVDSSMSFGATKIEVPSNNGGLDTVFTMNYDDIDDFLATLGVARGDSMTLYWKVIASNGTLTTNSTEIWSLNVVRDNYIPSAFDLISPPNGYRAFVSATNTDPATMTWGSSVDPEGDAMSYTWMLDSSLAFGPTTWAEFTGTDTSFETAINTIDAYVSSLGVAPGDSIILYWAVTASDGFHNVISSSVFEVNVVRELLVNNPPTPSHLLFPDNGVRIVVYPNMPDTMNMTWTASIDPESDPVDYKVFFDVVPTFDSGDLYWTVSNNSGADTVWTAELDGLEDYTDDLGVPFGDSITLYWKVVSSDGPFDINSVETFTMNVVRTLPPPTVIFFDDFESGTTNWTLQGTWGLSTTQSHSPTHALTESPTGLYAHNLNNITATLTNGLDLSTALDATLSFWGRYQIEAGFDYMYLDASTNGTTWVNLATYDSDVLVPWQKYTYSLGGFVGNSSVKIRFRFFSDGAVNFDGMYIDDVEISASNYDASAPLITHTGTEFYEGTIDARQVNAEIIDVSGLQNAELKYTVDNGSVNTIVPDSNNGDMYHFTIPVLAAGSWVKYWIEATDNSPDNNFGQSDEFEYIAGNYISYDDPTVDFVTNFETGTGAAVRFNTPTNYKARLVTALIRNYTDVNRPNDSMIVHIWSDAAGLPGTDLITPFKVKPEATLSNTSPMTRIDLRPYASQLTDLTAFHIGFTVPDGAVDTVWITIRQPGSNGRASVFDGASWAAPATATDYHFRVIMDTLKSTIGIDDNIAGNPNKYELYQNYPNPFNPATTIKFDLKENAKVTLKIFNTLGQEVRTLVNSTKNAGQHHITWDGKDNAGKQVSSGLYIYRLQAGSFVKSHKMMFLK